jgi:hypothetical protein
LTKKGMLVAVRLFWIRVPGEVMVVLAKVVVVQFGEANVVYLETDLGTYAETKLRTRGDASRVAV